MKANKKTLMAVKSFLQDEQESWDKQEMIEDILSKTGLLKTEDIDRLCADECGIYWDNDEVCNLDDFIQRFTDEFIEQICNVLDSFVGEDISCYTEEDMGW